MGLPGAVFVSGFSEAWIGIGLGIGTYLNWKIVAHRLRQYSKACGDSITIPDFICNRFRDKTGASRMVAAVIILAFFLFYTASGFVAAAKLFTTMFGLSYQTALWIGAAVVVSYTLLGGYMAVCWTDFIQGTLMFVAVVLVPAAVVCHAGGVAATADALNGANPGLLSFFTSAATGKAVGGPVLIAKQTYKTIRSDIWDGIGFLRFINTNLAVMNLLPIPVLDGGLILFSLIAIVFRRRIPEKFTAVVTTVFMYILIALMLFLVGRDFWRMDPSGKKKGRILLEVSEKA